MDRTNVQEVAERHSFNAFINSFLKEWESYRVERRGDQSYLVIDINLTCFRIAIVSTRKLGKFQTQSCVQKIEGNSLSSLSPLEAAGEIISCLAEGDSNNADRFYERVKASFFSMANSLEARLSKGTSKSLDFIDSEQDLILGHPFHPTPKSREALSREDAEVYCPEYQESFGICWYLVDPEIFYFQCSESFTYSRQEEELFSDQAMLHNSSLYQKGYRLFPLHPWQEKVLKNKEYFRKYLVEKKIVPFSKSEPIWKATSSLRTVYSENTPFMLKFSLSLKLTNSVRHLLPKEVERGLQLYDVVHSRELADFHKEYSQFNILCEPFYLCLRDEKGDPSSDSVVVFRENPFRSNLSSKDQVVLSALTQDIPFGTGNRILELVSQFFGPTDRPESLRNWFQAYLENVLKPFLILQSNYGVLLGAHQQNLVISVENGIPKGCYFRDCQGTGYSELGFNLYSHLISSIKEENENVVSREMGHALFGYYLITNSTFGVISALCQESPHVEDSLLSELRGFLEALRSQGVKDSSFLDYLLESQRLKFKGNFFCSLKNINENTSVNPLEIYTTIKNPIEYLSKEKAL